MALDFAALEFGQERNLFFDGAMGTMLQRGYTEAEVYRQYIEAGSDILTANTFGLLEPKAIQEAVGQLRVILEEYPASSQKLIALDIGPTGRLLEPYGDLSPVECHRIFSEISEAGAEAGADLILIETMMDLNEMCIAVQAAKKTTKKNIKRTTKKTTLPVIATMSFDKTGRTSMGVDIKTMVKELELLEVDALGMNCGYGPELYIDLLPQFMAATRLPILVQPNAGLPEIVDGKSCYTMTPKDFAKSMAEMAEMGNAGKNVMLLGGCCGTTPEHIKEMITLCRP